MLPKDNTGTQSEDGAVRASVDAGKTTNGGRHEDPPHASIKTESDRAKSAVASPDSSETVNVASTAGISDADLNNSEVIAEAVNTVQLKPGSKPQLRTGVSLVRVFHATQKTMPFYEIPE